MTQQLAFTRFDLLNLISQPRQYLPALIFVVVAAVATPFPPLSLLAGAAIVSMMAATPFASDERGRLDTLYATLPTSRAAVVIGRYLTTLALWAGVSVVALVAAVLAPMLRGRDAQTELLLPMLVGGFAVLVVAVGLQLPIFFAMGYTRARPVRYAPILLMAGLVWVAGQLDLVPDELSGGLGTDVGAVLAVLVAVGVALLVLSAFVSRVLYARRQL